ncbi:MAG: PepSY domain-containing protein [Bosea sp. (in: a-proteobacteria)]
MREAVFAGHAVPANAATRAAREASAGDVVRVRLCHHEERLVYRITMLQRDGRVGHVTVDGSSGKVAEVR